MATLAMTASTTSTPTMRRTFRRLREFGLWYGIFSDYLARVMHRCSHLPPFGSIRPCDAGVRGVQDVLVDVVAYVDFHGTARSLVFPWCDGFGDAYFRVVVPVIAEGAEEERLIDGVVEFGFAP